MLSKEVCVRCAGRGLLLMWIFQSAILQVKSQAQGGANQPGMMDLMNALSPSNDEHHPFYSLTPTTPLPESVDCYVEIPATRVGGQCIRLGGNSRGRGRRGRVGGGRREPTVLYGCQAGLHLDLGNVDCNARSSSRRTENSGGTSKRVD